MGGWVGSLDVYYILAVGIIIASVIINGRMLNQDNIGSVFIVFIILIVLLRQRLI